MRADYHGTSVRFHFHIGVKQLCCMRTRQGINGKIWPQPMVVPPDWAVGNSLGPYFTVYPSYPHTDTSGASTSMSAWFEYGLAWALVWLGLVAAHPAKVLWSAFCDFYLQVWISNALTFTLLDIHWFLSLSATITGPRDACKSEMKMCRSLRNHLVSPWLSAAVT